MRARTLAAVADRRRRHAERARAGRAPLARRVFDADRRRRRQQRQDHGQGDDRADPRRRRAPASRRAAISTITSACRSRCCGSSRSTASRWSRSARIAPAKSRRSWRSRGPTVGLITNAGAEHLEGFGSLEGVARAEGEMVAGLDADGVAVINADDEFAGAVARHDARARRDLRRRRSAADFTAHGRAHRRSRPTASSRASRCSARSGERADRAAARRAAQRAQRARAPRRQRPRPARRSTTCVAGLAAMRAVRGRLQLKTRAQRRLDHRRLLQRQSRARCAPASKCSRSSKAASGWCSATWPSSASSRRARTREIGSYAREHGVERLFAIGPLRTLAVEAFGSGARAGSPTPSRWRARARRRARRATCACWSRARASIGSSAWSKRSIGKAKDRLTQCSTGSHNNSRLAHGLQRLLVPDVARDPRDGLGARLLADRRPADDRAAVALPDRPGGARRRPEDASAQGRHADHGRRADPRRDPASARCCGPTSPTASSGSCSASRSRSGSSASTTTT